MCKKVKALKNRIPDCNKCGWVELHGGNLGFFEIFQKYFYLIDDGDGKINTESFQLIFQLESIDDEDDKREFIEKTLIVIKTINQTRSEESRVRHMHENIKNTISK